jgi:hypothetical protein
VWAKSREQSLLSAGRLSNRANDVDAGTMSIRDRCLQVAIARPHVLPAILSLISAIFASRLSPSSSNFTRSSCSLQYQCTPTTPLTARALYNPRPPRPLMRRRLLVRPRKLLVEVVVLEPDPRVKRHFGVSPA